MPVRTGWNRVSDDSLWEKEGGKATAERMEELCANADDCWLADDPREIDIHKAFRHA